MNQADKNTEAIKRIGKTTDNIYKMVSKDFDELLNIKSIATKNE